jgi:hypothetical protein
LPVQPTETYTRSYEDDGSQDSEDVNEVDDKIDSELSGIFQCTFFLKYIDYDDIEGDEIHMSQSIIQEQMRQKASSILQESSGM